VNSLRLLPLKQQQLVDEILADEPISVYEVLKPEELSDATRQELGISDQSDGFKVIILTYM
jgi:hypothetical protein